MTTPDTTEAVMRAIAEPLAEAYGRLQDFAHIPGGTNCGDTTDSAGNCVSVTDGDYGQWASTPCPCYCHEGNE